MSTLDIINQALKNVNAKYGTKMKLKPMSEYVEEGCLIQAERAKDKASKQNNSKCGESRKSDLLTEAERLYAHAEAMESYRKSGGKLD